jgi:hypothetical protein
MDNAAICSLTIIPYYSNLCTALPQSKYFLEISKKEFIETQYIGYSDDELYCIGYYFHHGFAFNVLLMENNSIFTKFYYNHSLISSQRIIKDCSNIWDVQ